MKGPPASDILIPPRWRGAIRLVWLLLTLLILALFLAGLAPRHRELTQVCTSEDCLVLTLNPYEMDLLRGMGISLALYAAAQMVIEIQVALAFFFPALLIFFRRSDTWIGIIISLAFISVGFNFFVESPRALQRLYPVIHPYYEVLTSMTVVLFMLIFYLFPNGRFAPAWLKWVCTFLVAVLILDPLLIQSQVRAASATLLVVVTGVGGALVGVLSQIYRFRKVSNAVQRQQTKWALLGLLVMFSMAIVWTVFVEVFPLDHGQSRLIFNFSLAIQYPLVGFFPISIVISILRYRLWDIDLIIRRTAVYSLVTVFLGLTYFGSIVFLQSLLGSFVPQNSPAVIVVSTLLIAALFNPLRRRVQDFIDRRFYRQKYDAERALAQFATVARSESDLKRLTQTMLDTVQTTLQPQDVSMWMVAGTKSRVEDQGGHKG